MNGFRSLRSRLIASFMVVAIVSIAIIAWSAISHQRDAMNQHARQEISALSELIASNSLSPLLFDDTEAALNNLRILNIRPDIRQAVVFDGNGQAFVIYQRSSSESSVDQVWLDASLLSDDMSLYQNDEGLYAFTPMLSHGEKAGMLYLEHDLSTAKQRLAEFSQLVLLTVIIAIIASAAASVWLVSLFMTPMANLLEIMRTISREGDYSRRAPKANTREFNQLSASFNQMIAEIAERDYKLEQLNAELEERVKARTEALESALSLANEASHAKAEFLAVMSHEVRTPLNGVIGYAELLKLKQLDDDTQSTVRQLNASAKMLLALLNDILDFSKLDANKLELEQQPIQISSFVHSLLETHQPKADKKQLQLVLNDTGCDDYFLGDPLRLGQILNNLIDNAIKFTASGAVCVDVTQVERDEQSWMKFTVADNGVGISKDKLSTIFTPFGQADTAVTRKFGGTGLGLTICARLVQLMQGKYGVDSQPGEGSCFWFEIPMQRYASMADAPDSRETQQTDYSLEGKLVLLVEDNEVNQAVASGMLENLGCEVDIASGGREAVTMCRQQAYDLILMDYHMPEMDGLMATAQIRLAEPANKNSSTPIIALTADIQNHVQTKFRQAGANDLLVKPFTFKRLTELLVEWLNKPREAVLSAQQSSSDESVIDEAVFEDIEAMSGDQAQGLIRNIVDLYLQKSPTLLQDIEQGMLQGDTDKLFKAAHALKSSSANVGAVKVSAIAKELERMAREDMLEQAKTELSRLVDSYSQAEQCLKGRLGEAS